MIGMHIQPLNTRITHIPLFLDLSSLTLPNTHTPTYQETLSGEQAEMLVSIESELSTLMVSYAWPLSQ